MSDCRGIGPFGKDCLSFGCAAWDPNSFTHAYVQHPTIQDRSTGVLVMRDQHLLQDSANSAACGSLQSCMRIVRLQGQPLHPCDWS